MCVAGRVEGERKREKERKHKHREGRDLVCVIYQSAPSPSSMIKEQSINEENCGRIYPKMLIVMITLRRIWVNFNGFFFVFLNVSTEIMYYYIGNYF